jgi:hypothetical protein
MRTYIQKLSITADKLRERDQPLSEIQIVSKALTSLPETFRIVRSVWASVPAQDRTIDHLLQRLLTEENVIKSYQKKERSTEGAFSANSGSRGGFGRGGYRGRGRGVRGGFVDKQTRGQYGANQDKRPRCNYCKIVGHIENECYKKHGYPDTRNRGNDKNDEMTRFFHHQDLILEVFLHFSPTQAQLNTCAIKEGFSRLLIQLTLAPGLFLVTDKFIYLFYGIS